MYANAEQVGGDHYKRTGEIQHWDLVNMFGWDYFQGQIIKYVMRWKYKYEGDPNKQLEDLKKARHFLDKYIEEYGQFIKTEPKLGAQVVAQAQNPSVWSHLTIDEMMKVVSCHDLLKNLFSFEGAYGDGTSNYKCTTCKKIERARNLFEAQKKHICGDADRQYVAQGEAKTRPQDVPVGGVAATVAPPTLRRPEGP